MGFLRDLGAAATVGISATTKQKQAELRYENWVAGYNRRVEEFNQIVLNTISRFEEMSEAWEEAKATVLRTGALTVDPEGALSYGWFQPVDRPSNQSPGSGVNFSASAAGSIPGLTGLVGAPVATWTLVGVFGTAGTGAAISGLSGAAFTAATAAWLGRLGIAGAAGLGMRAAPLALGGIGLAVGLPIQIVVGANVAGRRERKAIAQIDNAISALRSRDSAMNGFRPEFEDLGARARSMTLGLVRGTTNLQISVDLQGTDSPAAQEAAQALLNLMVDAQDLCADLRNLLERVERELMPKPVLSN